MATKVYDIDFVSTVDGVILEITPLKIKYLREFIVLFDGLKKSKGEEAGMDALSQCILVTMKQFLPEIKTIEELEDTFDLPTMYKILDVAAGVKINEKSEETPVEQAKESGTSWEDMDLAKLESEVFLLGIWKDYDELESSLSMPELVATLSAKRDLDYSEKKFFAAIQGVDLDAQTGKSNAWEDMKARVFSGGQATNANDVLALQGQNAAKAGFGIGMGLDYERID
jgi:hypothetical protein